MRDKNVYAVSLHPGGIATELGRNWHPMILKVLGYLEPVVLAVLKTPDQGAATTIRTISISDEEFQKHGGSYFADSNVADNQLRSDMNDKSNCALLWTLSENILKDKLQKLK